MADRSRSTPGWSRVRDVQRERGEVAIEGVGTLDLTATERDGMQRIDVRELNRALHSLARLPLLSAFRYQRTAGDRARSCARRQALRRCRRPRGRRRSRRGDDARDEPKGAR